LIRFRDSGDQGVAALSSALAAFQPIDHLRRRNGLVGPRFASYV
jgi:hypothetical protein